MSAFVKFGPADSGTGGQEGSNRATDDARRGEPIGSGFRCGDVVRDLLPLVFNPSCEVLAVL